MNNKIDNKFLSEIVNTQRLGQRRRESEFVQLTKEIITYYYSYIDVTNKKTYTEASLNWIMKNIMTLQENEDFFKWVIQISTVCCFCNSNKSFLKNSIPEEYKKGISYPYLSIDEDTEKFIPKNISEVEGIKLTRELFKQSDADLKVLAGFFFLGGLSITEISEYSEGRITDIAAGVGYLKHMLMDIINKNQKSPDGEFVSLSEDNKLLASFKEGFFYACNAKYEEKPKETPQEEKASMKLKQEMLAEIKEVSTKKAEPSKQPKINDEILEEATNEEAELYDYYEPVKKQEIVEAKKEEAPKKEKAPKNRKPLVEQIPKITIDLKSKKEKKAKEEKKISDSKYYTLMGIGIAMAAVLLISFAVKIVTSVVNKNKEVEVPEEELVQDVTGNEDEIQINEQVTRLTEAYNNQVGTVTIVLSGTNSEAPRELSDDEAYYFYGSNYEFNLQYYFTNESDETSIVDIAEVDLEYTDRTEHFSKDNYESKKNDVFESNMEEYSFDDENQTITCYTDWQETDMHTAYDYEKEDCVTTWLSVLDSNKIAIETMGDGCDLLPVMAENLTTTINGETYELVFYSATGYYIKDDVDVATEGRSTNYTIVCNAYLETL